MSPTELLTRAVQNNARWCDAVCTTHGAPGEWSPIAWSHAGPTPRFYPNAVTLGASVDPLLSMLARLTATRPSGPWSVKDSFAALDLSRSGWDLLFCAEWLVRPAGPAPHAIPWVDSFRVRGEVALADWERAWLRAAGETRALRTFLPSLLANPEVAVLALRGASEPIAAGAIAFRASGVIGLSNLFRLEGEGAHAYAWAARAACRIFPDLPLVGYEQGEALEAARSAGFRPLGPLRVWTSREIARAR